jgi:hypothetical protein
VASETCRRTAELAGRSGVFLRETVQASCLDMPIDTTVCECPPVVGIFKGVDLTKGCDFARPFCSSATREPVGAPVCTPEEMTASPGSCSLHSGCEQAIELDDGAVVELYSNVSVACLDLESGATGCSCSNNSGIFGFEISGPTTDTTCSLADELCARFDEREATDRFECSTPSLTAEKSRCGMSVDCQQTAVIGDVEIGLRGRIEADCYSEGGSWACRCRGETVEDLDVEGEDAWEACTAAAQECPELVDMKLSQPGD